MFRYYFYKLELEDYALPGFVSGVKDYYGNDSDIKKFFIELKNKESGESFQDTFAAYEAFLKGNENATHTLSYSCHQLLTPVLVYNEKIFKSLDGIMWTHNNVYDFPYYMKADGFENRHIWIQDEKIYKRCVKPKFLNLSYSVKQDNYYTPISSFWGHPCVVNLSKSSQQSYIESSLYLTEKIFDSEADMKKDIENFSGFGDFTEFCNDIFADG